MQAVILAGGRGTRLGRLTHAVPKPMIRIGGVPYLEHQLRLLKQQSVTDIVLLTGYLGHQVKDHFGGGSDFGLRIRYSREPYPMGTGGALRHARDFLADSFLLIYGDSYLPIDYPEMLRSLGARDVIGLMAVYHDKTGELKVRGNCAVDKAGFVTAYHKTGTAPLELRYVEAGVMAFRRGVIDLIPPSGPASLEHEVFPILIARRQLVAAITSQRFYDIGTPDRLKAIERILA